MTLAGFGPYPPRSPRTRVGRIGPQVEADARAAWTTAWKQRTGRRNCERRLTGDSQCNSEPEQPIERPRGGGPVEQS